MQALFNNISQYIVLSIKKPLLSTNIVKLFIELKILNMLLYINLKIIIALPKLEEKAGLWKIAPSNNTASTPSWPIPSLCRLYISLAVREMERQRGSSKKMSPWNSPSVSMKRLLNYNQVWKASPFKP
jgi:hypothetical protein